MQNNNELMKTNLNPTFVVVASVALSACASFASQVEFKGLNNQSLGNATVQVDPAGGGLTISGIGTNGTDGVRIATGGDGGGTFDLGNFDPSALPVGAWLRWRAVDPSDTELQKVTIQTTASGGAFFADFTGLGAPTVSVALYSNDVLVATATGIAPNTPVATFGNSTPGGGLPLILNPCILHPLACYGTVDIAVVRPDPTGTVGSLISLLGQGPKLCTRLQISPGYNIPYFVPKYRVKATEITCNNLGTQGIANEGLVYFGLEHHALGQAQYNFDTNGALTVTNIGIGGSDGVEIALQNANTYGADMVALNPQPFPPGPDSTILTINATGNFAGSSGEQTLGDLRVVQLPAGMQLRADLPSGSPGPLTVELWQGGVLLTTYSADPAGPVFNLGQGFGSVSIGDPDDGPWCPTRPGPPRPPWWWSLGWNAPTQVTTPGGATFQIDHARLSPAPGQNLMTLTHVSFQAVGPQPLVFTDERAQRNGLTFQGNQHFALGNAILTPANGQLLVDNFGMAAGDGVEIALGRANGCEVSSPPLPLPPPGSALTYSVFGDVDGIPDRPAGAMTSHMTADGNLQVMSDFSAIGATHFTVAVLNGDTLVARQTGLPSASFTIQTSNSTARLALAMKWSPNGGGYMNAVKWAGDDDFPIAQPFSPPVHGTRVVVIPEDPLHQLGPQSRLRITGNGPTPWPWAIATERLNVFGHGHTALGSTYMTADTGLLSVANIGPGGTNGVSIDVGNSLSASVTLALDPSIVQGPQPLPWVIQSTAFGTIGGQPNQTFGSLSFNVAAGSPIQVSADFSPVGSPSHTIEVWNLGQMVQRITGHSGPVGTVSAAPVTLGVQDAGGANAPGLLTRFGQTASISIGGGPTLQGDTLLVRPGTGSPSVSAFQSLNLQAGGMNTFGVTKESDTPALTPTIGGISPAPGGGFQISVPTVFGYLYTLEATSALGPQPVPWTPAQTFLGDGTTKVITLSDPAYVGGPQGFFRVRLGNN
jgi:hypothetical protein